jgi:hypothetical protein
MLSYDTLIFTAKAAAAVLVTAAIIGVSKPLQHLIHEALRFLFHGVDDWGRE